MLAGMSDDLYFQVFYGSGEVRYLYFKVVGVSGVERARVQIKSNERSCPCLKW